MKEQNKSFLADLISRRTSFIEVLLTTTILALGINLVSGSIGALLGFSDENVFVLGLVLCLLSITYFVFRFSVNRYRIQNYTGFLLYNRRSNDIISIRDYYFSRIIKMYIDSALQESPTMKNGWNEQSLDNVMLDDDRESIKIIREAIEYFIIKELSVHLQEYFKDSQNNYVKPFYKSDLQDVLEGNRFLQIFTTPRFNAPDESSGRNSEHPETSLPHNLRSKFVLVMPRESKIRRKSERRISIDTNKFSITIEPIFYGVNYGIPTGFHRYYLNLNRNDKVTDFSVGAKVDVSFKLLSLISNSGLDYYRWLDSFLERLDKVVSEQTFFDEIQWKANYPLIEHINTITSLQSIITPEPGKATLNEGDGKVSNENP